MPRQNNIQFRKGSNSEWISQNPTLASGEPGYDLSNKILKVGDGTSPWANLSGINQNIAAGYDISVTNTSGIYTIASTNLVHTDSQQPQGFVNRSDSRISVSGNVFRIEPTGSSYSYYNKGVKVVKTSGNSLTIPNLTQINYIHFDTVNNQISNKTTAFDYSSDIPVAYIAWNSGVGPSGQMTFFAEERHGIVMDTSTHKWIHNTFGAQYVDGLSIGNYVLGGNGSSNTHATISIGNGTLYQEDIEINITDSSSTDPFCQELSPTGQIPVYYHQGSTGQWVKNTATDYPVKYGANGPQYNLLSGGTWTTPDVSPGGARRYFAVWILATNQIDDPIISIMGQRVDSNQGSAESNNSWSDVNLTNLPLSEVKPLYRLIFAGDSDYTNVPKCSLLSILDIRVAVISTIAGVSQNDHGSLFGLGDDDHSQYLHVDNNRTVNAVHNFVNGINLTNNQGTLSVINDNGGLSINFGSSEAYNFGLSIAAFENSISAPSGNFSNNLTVNNTGVSLTGHSHTASNITNFNSSVSGLFPPTLVHTTGNQTLTGNLTIGGDLTVNGSTVITNVDAVTVEDPIITLGLSSGNIIPNLTHDRGLALVRGTGLTAFMGWDTSESEFILLSSGVPGANSGTYTPGTYGNLRSNEIFCTGINLTPIGKVLWGENNGVNRLYLNSNGGAQLTMYDNIDINTDGVIRMYSDTVLHLNIGADGVTAYSGLSINNQTASTIASFNANKQIVSLSTGTYPSLTELSYVKDVTSAVQTQLNNKQATLTNPVTGTGITNHIPYWSSTSGLLADSSQLYWDNTNNRLGIGTSSPASQLHVIGSGLFSGDVTASGSFIGGSGTASSPSFEFVNDPDTGLFSPAANAFGISTSGVERLRVDSAGNIGIGTSSPGYKLQVNGSFAASTKSFRIHHPSKKDHSLEYGSLESPYHGVRLTGRGTVIKGVGMVSLPDYLKDLIHDDDTLNIQITNIKHSKTIYVDKIDLQNDRFIVKADRSKTLGNLEFFWTLSGVRKDVNNLVVEKRN